MVKKKLALIGSNGIPAYYGGTETFYENLTRVLSDKYDITVYCSKKQPREQVGDNYLGAKLKYLPLSANGWQSIPYDAISVIDAARKADLLYVFGSSGLFMVRILRLFGLKKPVFLNHGGLDEWKREKYSRLGRFWAWWNRKIVRNCVIHVVDNELYVKSLEETFGIKDAHVIRYGGDQAEEVKPDEALLKKYPFLKDEYYVAVARAQIDNNLHIMLEAFAKIPEKRLVLVSNFKVSEYGQRLYEQYKDKYPNMVLIAGIYDKRELNAVRSNAIAYIHSHSRCGTPPSLCEAMNLGLPIISFDAEVNHEVTKDNAFFFTTSDDLAIIVETKTKDELNVVAKQSKELAKKELTWKHIGDQYAELFG